MMRGKIEECRPVVSGFKCGEGTALKWDPKPEYDPLFKTKLFLAVSNMTSFRPIVKYKYPYLLMSYAYVRRWCRSWHCDSLPRLFELYGGNIKDFEIMIDSGSYTVTTKGVDITIEDYIDFLYDEWGAYTWYVNLDLQFKPDIGVHNYLTMCAHGLHDAIHVHHRPEPWKYWDTICKEFGPYVGLSPMPSATITVKRDYFKKAYALHPGARAHWFGSGAVTLIRQFNPYSADISSYSKAAGMGQCYFPFGYFYFGRSQSHPKHWANLDKRTKRMIREYLAGMPHSIEDRPMRPEDLLSPCYNEAESRTAVNVWYYMLFMQKEINRDKLYLPIEDGELLRHSPWYHGWEDKPIVGWN